MNSFSAIALGGGSVTVLYQAPGKINSSPLPRREDEEVICSLAFWLETIPDPLSSPGGVWLSATGSHAGEGRRCLLLVIETIYPEFLPLNY